MAKEHEHKYYWGSNGLKHPYKLYDYFCECGAVMPRQPWTATNDGRIEDKSIGCA